MTTIRTYYLLTKPGIIMGNLITMIGGFALASHGSFNLGLFSVTFTGLGLIIASACVFNNYIDRDLDKKMERTKTRALALGTISNKKALLFANGIGIVGLLILVNFTNFLAAMTAFLGWFIYVGLYSFWKSKSGLATLVGSIAGATPPVIGYVACSNRMDLGALLLFAILFLWQMPHFFSIAMFRLEDYTEAKIPTLPVTKGNSTTKVHMLLYIFAFLVATSLLSFFGFTKGIYLAFIVPLGLAWFTLCIRGFRAADDKLWAKKMFRLSLYVITAFSFLVIFTT